MWDDVLARHERLLRRGAPRGGLAGRAITPSPVRRSTEQLSQQRRTVAAAAAGGLSVAFLYNDTYQLLETNTDTDLNLNRFAITEGATAFDWSISTPDVVDILESGWYLVTATIRFDTDANGDREFGPRGGSGFGRVRVRAAEDGPTRLATSYVKDLTVGNSIEFSAMQTSGIELAVFDFFIQITKISDALITSLYP